MQEVLDFHAWAACVFSPMVRRWRKCEKGMGMMSRENRNLLAHLSERCGKRSSEAL
jgi:hypothetical protein